MGSVPQLDFSLYPSQVLWFLCAFAFLYYAVVRVVIPKIESVIGERYSSINQVVEHALGSCESIDKELLMQRRVLEDADCKADNILQKAFDEVGAAIEEANILLAFEVDEMLKIVGERLKGIERETRSELEAFSAEVAFLYCSKIGKGTQEKKVRLQQLAAKLYGDKL